MHTPGDLGRVTVSFDEPHLLPQAGLLPVAALAQALTVTGSILVGGDWIDDTAVLRAGASAHLFDQIRAPSTIGAWLRAFKWSNLRELDAVSRELLARPWAAGAGRAPRGDRARESPRWSDGRCAANSGL